MAAQGAVRITSISGDLTVTLTTASGATPAAFSDRALTTTTSLPATVASGTTTTFYLASPGTHTLSVKTAGGTEIAADGNTTRTVSLQSPETTAAFSYDTRFLAVISGDSGHSNSDLTAKATNVVTITQQAADYTLTLADAYTEVEGTKATAQTITVPPHSSVAFPVGATLNVRQIGAGQITIANGAGVTLRAPNGAKTSKQYSTIGLIQRVTDEWVVLGDTAV